MWSRCADGVRVAQDCVRSAEVGAEQKKGAAVTPAKRARRGSAAAEAEASPAERRSARKPTKAEVKAEETAEAEEGAEVTPAKRPRRDSAAAKAEASPAERRSARKPTKAEAQAEVKAQAESKSKSQTKGRKPVATAADASGMTEYERQVCARTVHCARTKEGVSPDTPRSFMCRGPHPQIPVGNDVSASQPDNTGPHSNTHTHTYTHLRTNTTIRTASHSSLDRSPCVPRR